MKWFKHMSESSLNGKLQSLEGRHGLEGYAFYFKVVELCAAQYDGISDKCVFVFNWFTLQNKLRMKRKRIQNLFRTSSELNFWNAEVNDFEVKIDFPKLLEIRHRDAIPSSLRTANIQPETSLDIDIEEDISIPPKKRRRPKAPIALGALPEFSEHSEFLANVKQASQKAWIKQHKNVEWINREIWGAKQWLIDKNKKYSNITRFISIWLKNAEKPFAPNDPEPLTLRFS